MPLAVLPAAGASRRMGRPKLLLPYGQTTVVGSLVAALRRAGVAPIALVTAPGDAALRAWAEEAGLVVAVNPDPSRGMLSSIRAGIEALGGPLALAAGPEPLLVAPADLPALQPETVRTLLAAMRAADAPLAVPVHGGRRGHPLAIAPPLVPEVWDLDLEVGLKQLLERHAGEVLEVVVADRGAVVDVDTPEDYRGLTRGFAGN